MKGGVSRSRTGIPDHPAHEIWFDAHGPELTTIQHSCQSCSLWELVETNAFLTDESVIRRNGESLKHPENVNFLTQIGSAI